jgi:hypothetical protein
MEIKYKVFSANSQKLDAEVTLPDNTKATVQVEGFVVQLTTEDHGTVRLQFIGADVETAKATFVEGAAITATFGA